MSNVGINKNTGSSSSSFHEFRKQASFFFKEKIKTARLALTDVTPAQLLVEEAANSNPWAPDTRTLKMISKAAFEVDDYWRIVDILHKRLERFDEKNWRASYNAMIVLEHLLTQGPESIGEEFQTDKDVIKDMTNFQFIDQNGFNWGLNVRKKSEKILKLLNEGAFLKEERQRARKLSRGIEGFGSFNQRTSSATEENVNNSSLVTYRKSKSLFYEHENEENLFTPYNEEASINLMPKESTKQINDVNLDSANRLSDLQTAKHFYGSRMSFKENTAPKEGHAITEDGSRRSFKENVAPEEESQEWDTPVESNPLLGGKKDDPWVWISREEDHPFTDEGYQSKVSLLSASDQALEAC